MAHPLDRLRRYRRRTGDAASRERRAPVVHLTALLFAIVLFFAPLARAQPNLREHDAVAQQLGLQRYETAYYVVYTDLDESQVKESALRITAMAEEYADRTRGFAGAIRNKFPFFLFRDKQQYYAAGGMRGSAGVFDGSRLMAIAGDDLSDSTWHVVQHEGFHQFAHAVIGGDLPMWVNEGMAEYFGESLWTGDHMFSGVIPPGRLARVKKALEAGAFPSIPTMLGMTNRTWNMRLRIENYDMAWMLCHFLAHGDNGKYQKAFGTYISLLSRGKTHDKAWADTFGAGDNAAFDKAWRDYWMKLPDDPTRDVYAQATTSALVSMIGRAHVQGQRFDSFDAFLEAAKGGTLKSHADDWLPPTLIERTLKDVERLSKGDESAVKWELIPGKNVAPSTLKCTLPDGRTITGKFLTNGKRVGKVTTTLDKPPAKKP